MSRGACWLMAAIATVGAVLRADTHPITSAVVAVVALAWLHAAVYGGPLTDNVDDLEDTA